MSLARAFIFVLFVLEDCNSAFRPTRLNAGYALWLLFFLLGAYTQAEVAAVKQESDAVSRFGPHANLKFVAMSVLCQFDFCWLATGFHNCRHTLASQGSKSLKTAFNRRTSALDQVLNKPCRHEHYHHNEQYNENYH